MLGKLRTALNKPYYKYPLIAAAAVLWLWGLQDQLGSPEPMMAVGKYAVLSGLLVAIAVA